MDTTTRILIEEFKASQRDKAAQYMATDFVQHWTQEDVRSLGKRLITRLRREDFILFDVDLLREFLLSNAETFGVTRTAVMP